MTLANAPTQALTPAEAGLWGPLDRAVDKARERRRRRYLAAVKRRLRRYDPKPR